MENAVEITRLVKSFGRGEKKVVAVNGIDLTIPRGQIVSLLGPNGAGKTTLNDIILGLTTQTSGTISVLGKRPAQAINDSQVSALLQSDGFRYDMSVEEVVRYIAAAYPHKVDTTALMERTELIELRSRKVAKLSGGELQRLKFTLAMVADPELLVLDEPTAGMDVRARKAFWETMRAEALKGRTVIFATHYLNEAEEFADRIVLMNKGSIIADGPTREIRRIAGAKKVSVDSSKLRPETIADLEAEYGATTNDGRLTIASSDSDAVAAKLLNAGRRDLDVTSPSLDEAFDLIVAKNNEEQS